MKFMIAAFAFLLPLSAHADGSRGTFGINAGLGLPLLGQLGANIYFSNDFGFDLDHGQVEVTSGGSKAKLTMPSASLKYHPMSGSFFISAGVGQEEIDATGTDSQSGQTAQVKIKAMTGIAKLGWMWGSNDGGFWFGLDLGYIFPFNPEITITSALPPNNSTYRDVKDQAEKYGRTAYPNVTFARVGYLF